MADPRFFNNHGPFTLTKLCEITGASLQDGADGSIEIKDVAALDTASDGDITFLSNMKYKSDLPETKASACIIPASAQSLVPEGVIALISDNPYKAYALIAQAFYPIKEVPAEPVHKTAVVDPSAKLGKDVVIGANTVIGPNVEIGDNTWVGANVTITHALIGANCRIFNGVCIGQDGFGFAIDPAGHVTVPQLGRVVIEDYVEIGANTTIDRGAGPDTLIGMGTRIDNLVQIGHNVKIGKGCVIIAQSGISGSAVIEDFVVIAAQAGVAGHLTIGKGAQVAAKTGVPSSIEAGAKVMGYPAKNIRDFWAEQAIMKRMLQKRKAGLKEKE